MSRFDEVAKRWDSKSKRVEIAKSVIKTLLKNVDIKDKTILDYGCGTGLLAYGLSQDAKEVIGMDSSRGMLEVFKQKNEDLGFKNVSCRYHDADDMDLANEEFDGIVSSMTLHHIKDTQTFLDNCSKSLRQEGFIAIADLDEEDGSFHSHGNEGVAHFGFSHKRIKTLYEAAGLEPVFLKNIHFVKKDERKYPIFLAIGYKR